MTKPLSKLTKVSLRDVWGHEATDFTRWLSEQSNLEALSEEVGVSIKLVQTEASVGKYFVDILAEEESSGRKIIIENQLEDTNHDHLGKIITYASGYNAEIVVWIVKDYRQEHQKAIEWLNDHTDENISFFLIRIELWQIEGSNPAPKFETIVGPNEWAKTIKSTSSGELTNTKLQQLDFWTKFKASVQKNDTRIKLQSPRPQHWYDLSMGSSISHIALTVNTRDRLIGCEMYISKNRELFNFLKERKDQIEQEIGEGCEWVEATKASMIKIKKPVSSIFEQNVLNANFVWLYSKAVLFQRVFGNYLREFKR